MPRTTRVAPHFTAEEIDSYIKKTKGFWKIKRWMIIRYALVSPSPAEQIAKNLGTKKQTVSNLVSVYNRFGIDAIETPGKGQRQKAYLTQQEEEKFLEPFFRKAQEGQISTVAEIHRKFEERIGHPVHKSTVYRLLHRHQWRKIVPRPSHIQSDKEQQDAFKKTSRRK